MPNAPLIDRRTFLKASSAAALISSVTSPGKVMAQTAASPVRADYTLKIAGGTLDLGPQRTVKTTLYNGQFPGPLIRLKEGRPVIVDFHNDTDLPEVAHWHGQMLPSDVDGAIEEGTPVIPPRGTRRIEFTPKPSGFRFLHTHVRAGSDLTRGAYSGLAAPVYIEPAANPGAYDQEVFLVLKEFEPSLQHGGDMDMKFLAGEAGQELQQLGLHADARNRQASRQKGFEVSYRSFCINGKMLGAGDPLRVKAGDRVLFHVLNASAGEIRSLALPGHVFQVVALDGNPVPTRAEVPVLWLGTAERVSAIVDMKHPGIWILGDLDDADRKHGMGLVVEYAQAHGAPKWIKPAPFRWDYGVFADHGQSSAPPDETIEMLIVKNNGLLEGFNQWTLNGEAFSMQTMQPQFTVRRGRRYRLKCRNASDDIHPLHLHRHSFEVSQIHGKSTAGLMKDVVMLGGFQELSVDFLADNPGPTLFHCHQQLHMDFGFMALFRYAGS